MPPRHGLVLRLEIVIPGAVCAGRLATRSVPSNGV
jgi:hypothetical protein